ncbi:hypothetical protein [Streptomyces sp. A5-4]|uniref:hypothetical protein n=1 Tax=Streptomyces sp. A5-4 TaxID=3384771 RepID=UPI003DA8EE84
MRSSTKVGAAVLASVLTLVLCPTAAFAYGEGDKHQNNPPDGPSGGSSGNMLTARAGQTSIKVTQVSGGKSGKSPKSLAPVDPNWKPPACWYEPVATPEQLKAGVERLKAGGDLVPVTPSLSWGEQLMVDHYEKGEPQTGGDGYKDFNVGKDGKFWRGVINENMADDPRSYDCERNLFWQDANTVPDDKNAPTPEVLAGYAYDKIKVPETEIELKPAARSTVNLPTWVWLDKGTFDEVRVRAELPGTNVWAQTTAKPVSLHLEPGTDDAQTYPASGECVFNGDGSIGTPFTEGSSDAPPPCGITYRRSSNGAPYQLKASVTWEISWVGTGGAGDDTLPDGIFETTQDMNVQEIQAINR